MNLPRKQLKIIAPSTLTPVLLDREISDEQAQAITRYVVNDDGLGALNLRELQIVVGVFTALDNDDHFEGLMADEQDLMRRISAELTRRREVIDR